MVVSETLSNKEVRFDLNGEVPKLFIKGQEVGIVSMTNHYVTANDCGIGSNTITFIYMIKDHPEQKVLSFNLITGEVFNQ